MQADTTTPTRVPALGMVWMGEKREHKGESRPLMIASVGRSVRVIVPSMDPVSLVASSIAFIGACRKLASGLKFLRDLSRAPEEVLDLTDELNHLQNVLTVVNLVVRKRRDDTLGVLLSPLFVKVDLIIHELCNVCGACPQRLKEDDEYTEQLQHHLLARFKWTRAKRQVGELRARLKIIRLDIANSLAATSM